MKKSDKKVTKKTNFRPALSPEMRETQLISLSMDLAEQKIRDGTASSQLITHFLKLGTTREQLELEKIKQENLLLQARTDAIQSAKHSEELYSEAIRAMRSYGYRPTESVEEDDQNL